MLNKAKTHAGYAPAMCTRKVKETGCAQHVSLYKVVNKMLWIPAASPCTIVHNYEGKVLHIPSYMVNVTEITYIVPF